MWKLYKIGIATVILLMIAAPAVSVAECAADGFRCCGIYTSATEIGAVACSTGWHCYDAKAEQQDKPDVYAASALVQPIVAEVPPISDSLVLAELGASPLPFLKSQPLLCIFLI